MAPIFLPKFNFQSLAYGDPKPENSVSEGSYAIVLLFINNELPFNNGLHFQIEYTESSWLTLNWLNTSAHLLQVLGHQRTCVDNIFRAGSRNRALWALQRLDREALILTAKFQVCFLGLPIAGD